jgi:rhodanese-related sulfurtransferase
MRTPLLAFVICFFLLNTITNCNAQEDPFGQASPDKKEVETLPSGKLPDFETYRKEPGNVKITSITTKELASILNAGSKEPITIIDARSQEEYEVSHIKNSKRTGYEDFSNERIWMVSREARVIVYSTNKNRGTVVAQYLKLMGFSDIQVLEDGLIGWKNEKNEIYNADGATNKIHVGTKANAKFVKSGLAVY